jgi:hypothetical protein
MEKLPYFISLFFILTTIWSVILFYLASYKSNLTLAVIVVFSCLHMGFGLTGFYKDASGVPPRFALLIVPQLLLFIVLFNTRKGRLFLDGLDIQKMTLLHVVRIPVEIALYLLAARKFIPELMTFEGYNFDIFSGISAIVVYYFIFIKQIVGRSVLLIWNIVCLTLVIIIAVLAILSVPTQFQQWAFEQPNIALAYFPFVWLPSIIVPIVVISHLAAIRQLLKQPSLISQKDIVLQGKIT